MEILIREHVDSEQEVLRGFLYLAIYTPTGQPPPSVQIIQTPELSRYVENWGKPDDQAVFAVLDEKIVGACWTRCFSSSEPGYGFIKSRIPELSIAVLPEYQQIGIGTKLIVALLRKIQDNYPAISLSVSTTNPAKHLYEKLGFKCLSQSNQQMVMIKRRPPSK